MGKRRKPLRATVLQGRGGEILISEDGVKPGGLDVAGLDSRLLGLKGISQPVSVKVVKTWMAGIGCQMWIWINKERRVYLCALLFEDVSYALGSGTAA